VRRDRPGKAGVAKMASEKLSDDVLVVALSKEPQLRHELEAINDTITDDGDYDVVADFAGVEILTSSSISNLVIHSDIIQHF